MACAAVDITIASAKAARAKPGRFLLVCGLWIDSCFVLPSIKKVNILLRVYID